MAFASFAVSAPTRADDAITVDHAPEPLVTKVYQVADLVVPLASESGAKKSSDFEWLIDLIELRTGADCWPQGGGQGALTVHESTLSLVVRQSHAMHERIADLLSEVRGTGDLALSVEIQLIQGDLDACGDGKIHRTAQGLVDAAGKQRLLMTLQSQKESAITAAPKITFFNGTTASIETTEEGCSRTFNVRGVISKDNRYSRLWIDAKINGETSKAEVLIPEGHTAVRKLPGENSWLLLTSHVINAEEPQVIAPLKQMLPPSGDQKRYLVPVDETPEPAELTSVPQFKAQAEAFGLSVASRPTEHPAATSEPSPALVNAVEQVEYQVAHAEPAPMTEALPEAPAQATVQLEELPAPPELDNPREANSARGFANVFTIEPEASEEPARLNLCLDDADCQSPQRLSLQVFDNGFVAVPQFPIPLNAIPAPSPAGQRTASNRSLPHVDFFAVEGNGVGTVPRWHGPDGVLIFTNERPRRGVVQASAAKAPAASLESNLKTAASQLEELGLNSEARMIRSLQHSLEMKARERCRQIDLEIARLQAARARLEQMAGPSRKVSPANATEVR
ncbi:hypothetical protein [Caulifigura coniformis]|nr:hypothetical protein [Caulifigura coniformis]